MDDHIKHLMEFWGLSYDRTLKKMLEVIDTDRAYFMANDDVSKAVKKFVINNKKFENDYIREELEKRKLTIKNDDGRFSKWNHINNPWIIIKGYHKTKRLRIGVGFWQTFFCNDIPNYAHLYFKENYITIFFSRTQKIGALKVTFTTNKTIMAQLCLSGFMNFYDLEIDKISGYYLLNNGGILQDKKDENMFYLDINKRIVG